MALAIIPRVGWRALNSLSSLTPRSVARRRGVVVHYNGPPVVYTTPAAAMRVVQGIQRYHRSLGWSDGAYSYVVDQFGNCYEMRGDAIQFANGRDVVGTYDGPDVEWYTVMWLGGQGQKPTPAAIATIVALVELKRSQGAGMALKPHCDFRIKPCPGPELIELCRRYDGKPFHHPTPKIAASEEDEMPETVFIPDPAPAGDTGGRAAGWLVRVGGEIAAINGARWAGEFVGEVVAIHHHGPGYVTVVTKVNGRDDYPTYTLGAV